LHYNFPPYSVGEVKRLAFVSRREIGHGHLAERALSPVLPNEESFPYTIRLVSEVLESNGSSSMASVCSGSMALMAAGVPVKCLVSGVAMGLISDGENVAILTDILGTEDHMGDMDFKVTGTTEGITAIQMDIKVAGITSELMKKALEKAKTARLSILDTMSQAISEPRSVTSSYAPEIVRMQIDNKKIGDVIGPGGKTIREMQERYECDINIDDDGVVVISSEVSGNASNAKKEIEKLTESPQLNKIYTATIKSVVDFGAFAEFLPKRDGLIHISEIADEHVKNVTDYVNEGDVVKVKLIGFERDGKVRLTMKGVDQD
ncbi:MAG: polyribonucleotide nucleotidyltransferase, partial [Chitinivibrionales bacterium]